MARDPHCQARCLWQALAPERWPLPPGALPAGTALVGGAVRDGLLGRLGERPDLDLVVRGDAIALARTLSRRLGGSCVVLDRERSIARLVLKGWTIDLARRSGGSLAADLARRDFRINAIALQLPGPDASDRADEAEIARLEDPQGGLGDLTARRLTAISEANLLDDPLRLLRGVRLAAELGFVIEPATMGWIELHHGRISEVAPERVLAELDRLAAAPAGEKGLIQAHRCGLLRPWSSAPGANPSGAGEIDPAWLESLGLAAAAQRGLSEQESGWALPLARLATLLDADSLERLHASRRLQQRCRKLRHWWARLQPAAGGTPLRLDELDETERLKLQHDLESDLPALLLTRPAEGARTDLQRWRSAGDPLFHPRPPLDGWTLQQQLDMPPGPELGRLIDHLTAERAFGRLPADAGTETTLALARRWLHPHHRLEGGGRHD